MPQETTPGVFITEQEFAQLDNIIGVIPAKYAISIIDFFRAVQHKRNLETQQVTALGKKESDTSAATKETGEPGVGDKVVE